jgi:hypothetical protein
MNGDWSPAEKDPQLDTDIKRLTGIDRKKAIIDKICPFCHKPVDVNKFRDEQSRKEFRISGLCQNCQDKMFGKEEETENLMKENLEVQEFSLKKIVENLSNIPRDGGARFGDEVKKLSPQQKKELMEKVSKFNEYGKVLRCETALMEMAKNLSEIGQMAESYAMTESGDYFQAEVVKRDFNEVKKITKDFSKRAKECYGGLQQLNALYEDMGRKMERYFEIQSLDEIASAIPQQEISAPAPIIGEVSDEEESLTEQHLKKN